MVLLTRAMRVGSCVICAIVIVAFVVFVANETNTASAHQQEVVNGLSGASPIVGGKPEAPKTSTHKSSIHEALDEASNTFTSPFSGITAGTTSAWTVHGVNLLLALLVYGFGLGYLARLLRVRL
jgi:uncharacterized membrane protein YraQ (UPF0718 family)